MTELFAQKPMAAALFFGILAWLATLFVLRTIRKLQHSAKSSSAIHRSNGPAPRVADHVRPIKPTSENWELRMHELGRELSARLDSKMGVLQQLLRSADQQAARLEELIQELRETECSPSQRAADRYVRIDRTADRSVSDIADEPSQRPCSETAFQHASTPNKAEEIYRLADSGLDDVTIARQLSFPVGEVQLILSLRGAIAEL